MPLTPSSRTLNFKTFAEFRDHALNLYLDYYPTFASTLGLHSHDHLLEDYSQMRRDTYVSDLKEALTILHRDFSYPTLDKVERFEQAALEWKLEEEIFRMTEYKEFEWNPMYYSELLELTHLFGREYAPLKQRAQAALRRLRRIPQTLAIARQNLSAKIDRTIVETSLMVFEGRMQFLRDIPDLFLHSLDDYELKYDLERALMEAAFAVETFIESVKQVVLPNSTYNSFKLGENLMQKYLRKTELVTESLDELLARGRSELDRLTAKLMEVSRSLDAQMSPHEVFRMYVESDLFSERSLIRETENMLERIRTFVVRNRIVSIPSDIRCKVEESPAHMRWAFAAMNSPGSFERVATEAYYYVTLPDDSMAKEQRREFMSGLNRSVMEIISIHEAYPGHYVHFLHLQQARSKVGKVFWSYSFIEGWAHYTEEMMLGEGWGNGDARVVLAYIQEALIRLCRYVASIEFHRGNLTLEEVQHLFEEKALMRPVAARKEAERAVFDPGFLFYTLGKFEINELRQRAQNQPGFSLINFHDELLSYGCAPLPLISRIMLAN